MHSGISWKKTSQNEEVKIPIQFVGTLSESVKTDISSLNAVKSSSLISSIGVVAAMSDSPFLGYFITTSSLKDKDTNQ